VRCRVAIQPGHLGVGSTGGEGVKSERVPSRSFHRMARERLLFFAD